VPLKALKSGDHLFTMEYNIKQVPEDFVVKEEMNLPEGEGRYSYYLLRKKGWTTQAAIERVARTFRKRSKYINFSGNKDKHAVTEQYISILHGPRRSLELASGEIVLEYLRRGKERINLGTASGNRFEITVRNLRKGFTPGLPGPIPNYFDEQRFGMNLSNHIVGKRLVGRDFQGACSLVPEIRARLRESPRDYVGALRTLPRRVLRIYAHSYQSWLWNIITSEFLEGFPHRKVRWPLGQLVLPTGKVMNMEVPIPGYGIEIPRGFEDIFGKVLDEEGVSLDDFRIKQFQEFDLKGDYRDLFVRPGDFRAEEPVSDELNPGKSSIRVGFLLPSGSYATMVIRALFS
jgi:tRNA pseudouridine13 synthase